MYATKSNITRKDIARDSPFGILKKKIIKIYTYMIDGILLVDKEEGISSYDVIRRVKKSFVEREKIGHSGTLDPFATGLLILLFGKATKLMDTFLSYEKTYEAVGEFGFATDTQDITGEVVQRDESGNIPHIEDIRNSIEKNFLGDIEQTPPAYSAKRVNGQRAYMLARKGKEFKLKPKTIHISQFEIYEYEYPIFKTKIKCSSGTYIRTLIHDLGMSLNTFATTKELRRTSIGGYNVEESVRSEELLNMENQEIKRRVIYI
jgi:tRNA pseudouridine55 synthase